MKVVNSVLPEPSVFVAMTEMRMGAMARSVFTFCSGDATCPATVMRTIASDEMIKIMVEEEKRGKMICISITITIFASIT